MRSSSRGNRRFFRTPPESFAREVRILMTPYALVPVKGPPGTTWRSLEAAQAHVSTVEHYSGINIQFHHAMRRKILECEMSVRQDWGRISRQSPRQMLSDVIALTAQRFSIWTPQADFRNAYIHPLAKKGIVRYPPPHPTPGEYRIFLSLSLFLSCWNPDSKYVHGYGRS